MRSRGLASEGQLLEGGHLSSAPRWGQSVALCLSHSLAAPPGKRRAQGRGARSRMPTSWRPGHTGALAQEGSILAPTLIWGPALIFSSTAGTVWSPRWSPAEWEL